MGVGGSFFFSMLFGEMKLSYAVNKLFQQVFFSLLVGSNATRLLYTLLRSALLRAKNVKVKLNRTVKLRNKF